MTPEIEIDPAVLTASVERATTKLRRDLRLKYSVETLADFGDWVRLERALGAEDAACIAADVALARLTASEVFA